MQRDLVEDRRWIALEDFKEGLALAQLAPGPLAAQLAIYLGWIHYGIVGATLVAFAFVLPSFVMVIALSVLYVSFGGLSWMPGVFYGVGAAVIAIIARSAYKLAAATVGRDPLLWVLFLANALVTAWTESELVWLFVASGVVALVARGFRPGASTVASFCLPLPWLVSGLTGPATPATLSTLFVFFAKAGAFVFGSGLAIVPFLHGGVVNELQWLTERQFLDAVAIAMITPGPVVITVAFIGYLVAGPVGATVAAVATFLPCYLFVVIPARYFRRAIHDPRIKIFVNGVTVAAAGAIAGAAFVLGRRAIVDLPAATIALVALGMLPFIKAKREPILILAAGCVGFAIAGTRGP